LRKFLRDAAEAFGLAVSVVAFTDGAELLSMDGSWEQLTVGGIAIGRAALAAGLRAVLPLLISRRGR